MSLSKGGHVAESRHCALFELRQCGGWAEQLTLDQLHLLSANVCHKVQHYKNQQADVDGKVGEVDEVLGVRANSREQQRKKSRSQASRKEKHWADQIGHVDLVLEEGVRSGVTGREAKKRKRKHI